MAQRKSKTSPPGARSRSRSTCSPQDANDSGSNLLAPDRIELRPYQAVARQKFLQGVIRQLLGWHRRAGKDVYALDTARDQADQEVGTYWHLYPTHVQARRAIWNGIDKTGVRFLERAFPLERRVATRSQDMQIELDNGSMWQLCGSDRYNSLVGSNPRGVVFSEFALCDPRSWDYVRPILRENGGWALFITTFRGKNHAWHMAQRLKNNPAWYVDIRTVEDTTDVHGERIITDADVQADRDEGMAEARIQEEYYCNPVAAVPGAIYGKAFERLIDAGRLGNYGYDSSLPVFAAWSLEYDDQYTVSFLQNRGNEARVIGSKSYPFEALNDCLDHVAHAWPWRYIARHIVPNGTPGEVIEQFEKRPGALVEHAPKIENVYSVTREELATTYVDNAPRAFNDDQDNNERLVDAMNGHRFTEAKGGQSFTNTPVNSWEKHYARTVEVFMTWRHHEPLTAGGWHPPPSTVQHDRAVI